jgi:hypothetical protein
MSKTQSHGNPPVSVKLGTVGISLLGIYLVALALVLGYLLIELWPTLETDAQGNALKSEVTLFFTRFKFTPDTSLMFLVILLAAVGSYVHAATSFVTFVGNRRMSRSWVWWYILRTFIGITLALIFYFVIRGGLLSAGTSGEDLNVYGIAAVAGLVGLCSKQATDKLVEVFNTLFKTKPGAGDEERHEKVANPEPAITSVEPSHVAAGAGETSVMIGGSGFTEESVVRVDGVDRKTQFQSSTRLTAHVLADDVASRGSLKVTVFNPSPGGGACAPITFTVQ